MRKSPAFRFYPSDFMGSPDVQAMDLCEVGAYILLLSTAWLADRHGYLPDDDERLRRWARMTREQWAQSREMLLAKFPVCGEGLRHNPRMVAEAVKQEAFSASQRDKSGKRWGKPKSCSGNAEHMPGDTEIAPGGIPSVSVSVEDEKINTLASTAVAVPADRGEKIGSMPLPGNQGFFSVFEKDAEEWQESYPGVDVRQQLRSCRQWLQDNPKKRKTATGMRRFINSWMAREQDKGTPPAASPDVERRLPAALGMFSAMQPNDGTAAVEYWRLLRNKGSPRYAHACPQWVKAILEKEA